MGEWDLSSKTSRKGLNEKTEEAVLVGVISGDQTKELVNEYLDELEFLALTAGAITKKRFTQKVGHHDSRTLIGSGKLEEIADYVERTEVTLVIFDEDLTGKQTNTLEEHLKVKILDRSSLILDIFARRAQTAEAKTQVELAQLQYLLPRLRGLWTHLERQRGGIGMRGPGEKEIETDRRIVRDKISLLKKKLEKIDKQSQTRRKTRDQLIRVALVGYTNAGKSTIMNLLSKSDVFAEDKLFATLDTTVRKVVFERMPFLLSDTVGFIRKLPHHLVESFKSTLDEAKESDLLLHIVDISHPQADDHIQTVNRILKELEASEIPTVLVLNKIDLFRANEFDDFVTEEMKKDMEATLIQNYQEKFGHPTIGVSAKKKINIKEFRLLLQKKVRALYEKRYPYRASQF